MTAIDEEPPVRPTPRAGRRTQRTLIAIAILLVAAIALLWSQRKPIAADFVDSELSARGVDARYTITELGFRRQRLENISIGDPRAPDLTARWAELDLAVGLGGAAIRGITAGGVRLRGRLVDGGLRLGAMDRLLPPSSGKPFALPDLRVTLTDARMRLDTPAGPIGLKLDGTGNLARDFRGKLAATAPRLRFAGCTATAATAYVDLLTSARGPTLTGPIRARRLACPDRGILADQAQIDLRVALPETLDAWDGTASLAIDGVALANDQVGGVAGSISFAGNRSSTRGRLDLRAQSLLAGGVAGRGLAVSGDYGVEGQALRFDGRTSVARLAIPPGRLSGLRSALAATTSTPVAPLADALLGAAARAARELGGSSAIAVRSDGIKTAIVLRELDVQSASGARLAMRGGSLRYDGPAGALSLATSLSLTGGGFPDARLIARRAGAGAPTTGTLTTRAYAAGGARLALAPVRFTLAGDRLAFATAVTLDGPLGDGRVDALSMPITGSIDGRRYAIGTGCVPLTFRRLALSGLDLTPARLRLCAIDRRGLLHDGGGGATIDAPRLAGRLGSTPITLAASGARVTLAQTGFTLTNLSARLGAADRVSRLDFATVVGSRSGRAVIGRFTGGSGQIANVPLLLSDATGDWRLDGGALAIDAAVRVADADPLPRFSPVVADDVALTLANGRIHVTGRLREPQGRAMLTAVDIVHDLGQGVGRATLDVPGIVFDDTLQPDTLTRLALGVVANVFGTVSGQGAIAWSPQAVTSNGTFRTTDTALAAAFGPVTGLSGELRFTDLLGLESAPGQRVTLASVNPGILVEEGVVTYRLLPGQRIGIERGRWPFAGGELLLQPTILDFGADKARNLTFAVNGLDAAKFIEKLEMKNLAATGIFDGTVPMIFDAGGGRIADGALTVRPGGGTLAYVGDVSNADLGMFAKLAFDALKSIRYDNLTIELNGAIDGEMITQVRFNGVNQGTLESRTGIFRQFVGLPFLFNINIKAPFRGLLTTAATFADPSLLIRDQIDDPVQPQDSEPKR